MIAHGSQEEIQNLKHGINNDSKIVTCLRILEVFVKTQIDEPNSQSFLFRSEVRHKNSHFQQISGDADEAGLGSTLRTTSL